MSLGPEFLRFHDDILRKAEKRMLELISALPGSKAGSRIVDVPFVFGTPGIPLVAGQQLFMRLSLGANATVLSWSMAATVGGNPHSGSVIVAVFTGVNFGPLTYISGSTAPQLSGTAYLNDQTPSGWSTTTLTDPSWLVANTAAPDGVLEVVSFTLKLQVG